MSEEPRQGLTPCYVSRAVIRDGNQNRRYNPVIVHDRTSPCGHLLAQNETAPVPTFVEWMEEWTEPKPTRFSTCSFCGGGLR